MKTAENLKIRYQKALEINNKLASEIGEGNGATGLTATFFMNASKDLLKITNKVRKAFHNGEISIEEYKSIMA